MTTAKYDLHTIDYSVQGWDSILATDMEILEDVIGTRILGVLGETVAVYAPVMLKSDGLFYNAKADGTLQPGVGIARQTGNVGDTICIQYHGEISTATWTWTIGAPVYVSSASAGELTQTEPTNGNIVPVGYAISATCIYVESNTALLKCLAAQAWSNPEVLKTTSCTLSAAEVRNTIINNYGQAANVDLELPEAGVGMHFFAVIGTASGKTFRLTANASNKIYLDGSAGGDGGYVGMSVPTVGARIEFTAFKTDAARYDWIAETHSGVWEETVLSASMSPSVSPSASPSASPSISPSASASVSPSISPSASPSISPSASSSVSPSVSPSISPSASVSPSVSPSASASMSPSISPSVSPSASASASPSVSPSISVSASPSISPSVSPSVSASASPSESPSESSSASASESPSESPSNSPSTSPSASPSEA